MFKTKLERFIAKRAAVCLLALSIADVLFIKDGRWYLLAGMLVGSALGIARFSGYAWVFSRIIDQSLAASNTEQARGRAVASSVWVQMLNFFILLPFFFVTYTISPTSFIGFLIGLFTVPAVVMINSVTEALGITKNRFESF